MNFTISLPFSLILLSGKSPCDIKPTMQQNQAVRDRQPFFKPLSNMDKGESLFNFGVSYYLFLIHWLVSIFVLY